MQSDIFSDLVMEEAIKDKTSQVEKQMRDQEAAKNYVPSSEGIENGNAFHHAVEVTSDDEGLDDEEEKIMRELRDRRLAQLKSGFEEQQENKIKGHGQYREITETEFLPNVTGSKFVLVHFYHKDFERCKIIDMHLREIARQHTEARFVFLNAEKALFFIQKLQVQVLPTIIAFVDGVAVDRVVGFEDMGNKDDFPRLALTRRLIKTGALKPLNKSEAGMIITKKGSKIDNGSDDDEY